MSHQNERQKIVEICRDLHAQNMLAAADGNVSCLLPDGKILITPSGVSKARMSTSDLALIDLDGTVREGNPSSEREMHLFIYRNCPKAQAVVHAHPPHAIAWSIAQPNLKELPQNSLSELILATGKVPIIPYARPGTSDMGEVLKPFVPQSRVMILARHGALSWGENLAEAFMGMERVEHSASILKIATELGGITDLPKPEVDALWAMRHQLGDQSR